MLEIDSLTHESFDPWIGHAFLLRSGDQQAEVRLHTVKVLGHRHPGALRDPFSLLFRGQSGLRGQQGVYHLTCEGLGELEIFLTQVGDGPAGSEFEAIFT